GGIGAGCVCLNGHGGLQDFSLRNRPSVTALPDGHGTGDAAFALLHVRGANPITRLVEGPLPPEKLYDQALQAQGYRHGGHEGMPRFENCAFEARYPFGRVSLEDPAVPLSVTVSGWSPFIPRDDVSSGLPCAFLEYTLENRSGEAVDFEFSYHLSHLIARPGRKIATRNSVLGPAGDGGGGGVLFTADLDRDRDEDYGTAALYAIGQSPRVKAMWFRGGWFDSLSVLWREVSTGQFRENDGAGAENFEGRNGGSLLVEGALPPGASVTIPLVLAWHFPNAHQRYGEASPPPPPPNGAAALQMAPPAPEPAWRPFYVGQFEDARAVALHAAENHASLRARTEAFADALWSSTLPPYVLDAVASNLAILKSPTVLRQENGNVWAWEGCFPQSGCCHGSCTHVWNYAQALPHLFPALERTLREQELERSMDERGHVQFRAALPDGPTPHGYHAAADGQLGGILKLYRDWQISGDRAWLERLYPLAKRSLDFGISLWDPERRGGLFEPHHNTYDIEFWGPDGMCGSIYVGALAAMARMARDLGRSEEAAPYEELSEKAGRLLDGELFNGEYYEQRVQWEGLRDTSFAERMAGVTDASDEMQRLQKAEGPKYQYGTGCLSDGVIGAWMARIYGVETPLDRDKVRSSLRAIFAHNFKTDLWEHACLQRPGYALGHEPGLLLCTWPRGGKPTLPFVYSDEVWTGIEYQVASHLIEEGMAHEGLKVVEAVRSRYDGRVRNPFNEYECGSYYARAMSSYALLGSLSGLRYSAATRTLTLAPKIDAAGGGGAFRVFFSGETGFGTVTLDRASRAVTVEVLEGELQVDRLLLTLDGAATEVGCGAVARPGAPATIPL
ncbi:MAG TPA: GH116 family glycosyl hydrolase, partial [Armatimonadaceae bacterium]|nr:GH116 family glycosyl hydrolase [Armatimonadaceae bacterium]